MKKAISLVRVCALTLVMLICLAGCRADASAPPEEKAAVCYVLANTACSQGLNLSSPLVQDTVYDTIRNYGYISVVNADGAPDVVLANSYDIDARYKSASQERLDMDARSKAANLLGGMQSVIACDPEVDYMAALNLAVRSLSSLEGYTSKTIVVIGTGLSTAGVLDFQNNLLSADPGTVVELLGEKDEIPDFSGITVYWQQMGDVALPQESLTAAQRNTLQQIYGGLVEAGGGTFVYNDIIASPVNAEVSYPAVTPVDLPADTPIRYDPELLSSDEGVLPEPIVLTEEQVRFVGDQAEYLRPEEAEDVLRPIADFLTDSQATVLLCGTTAGDENSSFSLELSQARAEAVRDTLIQLSVDPHQIIAVGLGCGDPWHVYGVGCDSAAAAGNRKVVLLDASSQTARDILAGVSA